jgi:hypothetical protein
MSLRRPDLAFHLVSLPSTVDPQYNAVAEVDLCLILELLLCT